MNYRQFVDKYDDELYAFVTDSLVLRREQESPLETATRHVQNLGPKHRDSVTPLGLLVFARKYLADLNSQEVAQTNNP